MLAWFPTAFTQGCTIECKSLAEHGDDIQKYDVTYFMASVDPLEGEKGNKALRRIAEGGLPAAERSDQEDSRGVRRAEREGFASRWTFYIDKAGNIAYIDKAVKPATSAEDMAAKLGELEGRREEVAEGGEKGEGGAFPSTVPQIWIREKAWAPRAMNPAATTPSTAMSVPTPKCGQPDERAAQPVDAVGQRIEPGDDGERCRQAVEREQRARQEEDRHHQEVHHQLEALHVLQGRSDRRAQRREHHRDQAITSRPSGTSQMFTGRKPAITQTTRISRPCIIATRGVAERAAGHDLQPRHRRDQRFLEKAELAIPQQADAGEDRREQHRHADHARRDELQIAALPRLLEHRPETEPEHQQIQQRLAERGDHLRARPRVALQLAQPEDVDRAHRRLHIFAIWRIMSAPSARSSRIVDPVSARNAASSESVSVCSLSVCDVPCATMRP